MNITVKEYKNLLKLLMTNQALISTVLMKLGYTCNDVIELLNKANAEAEKQLEAKFDNNEQ